MRVLFWIEEFWPYMGGVSASAVDLLPDLCRRGHEFVVVTRRDDLALPEHDTFLGLPVRRFPSWQALDCRSIGETARIVREIRAVKDSFAPDLVHMFSLGPSALLHFLTKGKREIPLLVTLHGEGRESGPRKVDEFTQDVLAKSSWVTVPSESMRLFALSQVPDLSKSISCIRNAVREPKLSAKPLPFSPPRLLCLGRLAHEKGFDRVLRAFPAIHARFPHLQLIMAGDGPARNELEALAADLGIRNDVRFTGWVEREGTPRLIDTATIVAIPSRTEGLPLVALEASIMGRPIVATRVGGLPEIVLDGVTGCLVDGHDPNDFVSVICALLSDPRRTANLGQAARMRAIEEFRWEGRVDEYDALYRRLVIRESDEEAQDV